MSKSSRKGSRRELEWATFIGGEKKSRLGYEGPDVQSLPMKLTKELRLWEVKSKEAMPAWLVGPDGWLGQIAKSGADAVVFRQNNKGWYMIVPISSMNDLQVGEEVLCGSCGDEYGCACHWNCEEQ